MLKYAKTVSLQTFYIIYYHFTITFSAVERVSLNNLTMWWQTSEKSCTFVTYKGCILIIQKGILLSILLNQKIFISKLFQKDSTRPRDRLSIITWYLSMAFAFHHYIIHTCIIRFIHYVT